MNPELRIFSVDSKGTTTVERPFVDTKLSTLLKHLTFQRGRAIDPRIASVNLGALGKKAEELLDKTLRNPQRHEFLKKITVSYQGEVAIETTATEGEFDHVDTEFQTYISRFFENGSTRLCQEEFLACTLHSHGFESIPSPADMRDLLLEDQNIAASTAVFVITPSRKILICRGPHTPQLHETTVDRIIGSWTKELGFYQNGFQDQVFRKKAQEFDFVYFECSNSENTVKRKI